MQYMPSEYNNNNYNNIKHFGVVLRSNGMLLSHFKRNRDTIPPLPTPPQPLHIAYNMKRGEKGHSFTCAKYLL
jgi:hypothetical protein